MVTQITGISPDHAGGVETLLCCPLCSGTSFQKVPSPRRSIGTEIFGKAISSFGLQRCRSCSLSFVNPRPTAHLLSAFYGCDSYASHSRDAGDSREAQFLLECVARFGPYEGRQFLDFGCGGGFLLRAALKAQWNAYGYDVGERALASCRGQGLVVTNDLARLARSSFDVVFLNHVFEHIADPHAVLSACRGMLNQSGKLLIAVPNLVGMRARLSFGFLSKHLNVDERHRAFPIHLYYFTPQTLSRTLEKHGFRITALETFGVGLDTFFFRPGVNGHRTSAGPAAVKKGNGFRRSVKNALFRASLGENLLAVAQLG